MPRKWKAWSWAVFAALAFAYAWYGIRLDRESDTREAKREQSAQQSAKEMNRLLESFAGVSQTLATENAEIAAIRTDIDADKKTDPRTVANLEARTNAAQKLSDTASRTLLAAFIPGLVKQLRNWTGPWNTPAGKAIIENAAYIQQLILGPLPRNAQDESMRSAFASAKQGDFQSWNANATADYFESLPSRLRILMPVTDLTATVQ